MKTYYLNIAREVRKATLTARLTAREAHGALGCGRDADRRKRGAQKFAAHREEDDQERIRMMVDRSFTDVKWVLKKVSALHSRRVFPGYFTPLLQSFTDGGPSCGGEWVNAHSTE